VGKTLVRGPYTCAWCGSSDTGEPIQRLIRCRACGAATTAPPPSDDELGLAYGRWYRPAAGRFALGGDTLLRWSRGRLARRLDRIAPPGPVLDVGAGDGALVDALARRGRHAVGLERHASRPGIEAKELDAVDGEWAAVVFWHSLEHLRGAGVALGRAAGLLAPGGVLVVALPNAASLQASAFGDRWLALDLPRHLVHVPARALVARLEALGLRVERVSHFRGGQIVFGWLDGLVGSLPSDLRLYDAIRRAPARSARLSAGGRAAALAAGAVLMPAAVLCAAVEVALRRGGAVYAEARRA
jgi:SAM-dependent methyltransferase